MAGDVVVEVVYPEVSVDVVSPEVVVDIVGGPGPQGPPGPGNAEYSGQWDWTTSTTTAATGQVGNDGATWDCTAVNINDRRADNTDTTMYIQRFKVGDGLYVQDKQTASNYAVYTITAPPVDYGTWWKVPVAVDNYGGVHPKNNADTTVTWLSNTGAVWLAIPGGAEFTGIVQVREAVTGQVFPIEVGAAPNPVVTLGSKTPTAGTTARFTVPVVLPADPTANLQAATKQYADARWGRWTGTQAQYDAIPVKDPNTLYIVSG